jgi:hypothetical protein
MECDNKCCSKVKCFLSAVESIFKIVLISMFIWLLYPCFKTSQSSCPSVGVSLMNAQAPTNSPPKNP